MLGKYYFSGANNYIMASIKYKTYGKGKTNAPVYIRFSNGRNCNFEVKTGVHIPNSDFLKEGKTRKVSAFKNQPEIQSKLSRLEGMVSGEVGRTTNFSKDWLMLIVDEFNGVSLEQREPLLYEIIEKYVDHILDNVSNTRENSTVKTYHVTLMRLREFQKYVGREYGINEIDLDFKSDFIKWARNVANYQPSTFEKSLKQFKTVCRYAKRLKLPVDDSFLNDTERHSKKKSEISKPLFLSTDEIEKLMAFQGSDHLMNSRDWLVISCWTGCRVSDLMNLSEENVYRTIQGDKAIKYVQRKTRETVTTPIHYHVEEILQKNSGFPRPISPQRYNDYIKEVCRLVGMTKDIKGAKKDPLTNRKKEGMYPKYKLITSHIGRRSFATNHYGKFPIETCMLVTGHATVKQFLEYVGANPEEHVTLISDFYRDMKKQTTTQKIAK
jgi:site-specific recombinase XerD